MHIALEKRLLCSPKSSVIRNAKPTKVRDITLITKVGIDKANHKLVEQGLSAFDICMSRRNIVVKNLLPEELNALVEKIFLGLLG